MVGDRYELDGLVLEIIEIKDDSELLKCIETNSEYGWDVGETYWNDVGWAGWTYLGNFGKSNQFKTIYDILNS